MLSRKRTKNDKKTGKCNSWTDLTGEEVQALKQTWYAPINDENNNGNTPQPFEEHGNQSCIYKKCNYKVYGEPLIAKFCQDPNGYNNDEYEYDMPIYSKKQREIIATNNPYSSIHTIKKQGGTKKRRERKRSERKRSERKRMRTRKRMRIMRK